MLSWQFHPDEAFAAILDSSLSICIDQLSDQLDDETGDFLDDQLAGTIPAANCGSLVGTRIWELFDHSQLLGELQKLLAAHRSVKFYMPTDYHFLILHEVLQLQISYHNYRVSGGGQPLEFGGVLLSHVDFDFVADYYFWDEDFLLAPAVMTSLSEEGKKALGFNQETFALAQGLRPHPQELELKEIAVENYSPQSYYKQGECYPYDEESQE
jgi:hypothetical protein